MRKFTQAEHVGLAGCYLSSEVHAGRRKRLRLRGLGGLAPVPLKKMVRSGFEPRSSLTPSPFISPTLSLGTRCPPASSKNLLCVYLVTDIPDNFKWYLHILSKYLIIVYLFP